MLVRVLASGRFPGAHLLSPQWPERVNGVSCTARKVTGLRVHLRFARSVSYFLFCRMGKNKSYSERVKPFNFLGHAMPKALTALPSEATPDRFCLVAPAGERHRFVNRDDPKGAAYTADVDFTPKTYADLIEAYDRHPERKFAGADGTPCQERTRGLPQDLPLVVGSIRHVGKEGNELEAHRAGLVTETKRQLEYHDSAFEDLIAALQKIPTKVIADSTGYDLRTVRRLKRGELRPSEQRRHLLLAVAADFA